MDIAYLRPNVEKFLIVGVNLCLLYLLLTTESMYVLAENIKIVNGLVSTSPLLNGIQIQETINTTIAEENKIHNFNCEIERKYKNATITTIDKGLKHIRTTRYYKGKPVRLNIIETDLSLNPELKITPIIASEKTLLRKASISSMAQKTNSLVAVNGAFFKPQTGCPLGTLMIDKKIYTGPIFDRVAMGFFEDGYAMDRIKLDATIKKGFDEIKINNINQPRMLCTDILAYTPDWGEYSPATPVNGTQIVVSDNKVIAINTSRNIIPKDGFIISGPISKLQEIKLNDKLSLNVNTTPEWKNVKHIISGGPYLVKDGEVFVDMTAQKLNCIGGRNPRTAIGYTKDNHIIMITADGREGSSIGMTLTELAYYMQNLGCVNAMNLDGGGSTVMYVNGKIVNRPPVKGGIALSNSIGIYR